MSGSGQQQGAEIGEFWRLTAAETLVFCLKSGVATRRSALGTTRLERCDTDQHDAGANHAQIFGDAARYVDDAPAVPGVHSIVNDHDGAAISVETTHRHLAAQRKMIAGSGKLADIEALTGRGPPPVKAVAVKTGLTVQTNTVAINDVGEADFG